MFVNCPRYAHIKHHTLWDDWSTVKSVNCLNEVVAWRTRTPRGIADWSIAARFVDIIARELHYHPSAFLDHDLAHVERFGLPDRFAVLQGDTPLNPEYQRAERRIMPGEWAWIAEQLESSGLKGVVLNSHDAQSPPENPNIIDLTGKTTVPESLEILKRAERFYGIDSWLSVYAAMLLPDSAIHVRSVNPWLFYNRVVYYPTKRKPWSFITKGFPSKYPSEQLDKNMTNIKILREWIVNNRVHQSGEWVMVGEPLARKLIKDRVAIGGQPDPIVETEQFTPITQRAVVPRKGK
ncbi:MAG: hypothetical protein JWN86_1771 [Planctomycetota bacterium]|nr:hypothetical protein [Planctomycetota bacterium]